MHLHRFSCDPTETLGEYSCLKPLEEITVRIYMGSVALTLQADLWQAESHITLSAYVDVCPNCFVPHDP